MLQFSTLFLFLYYILPSSSFTTNGYFIYDLETKDLSTEISAWSLSSMYGSSKTTTTLAWETMPSVIILGGPWILGPSGSAYGQYFSRTYTGIVPHTYVAFTFMIWYFDNWTPRDDESGVKWEIDGVSVNGPRIDFGHDFWSYEGGFNEGSTGEQTEDCGFVHIKTGLAHSGSSMTFRIYGLIQDEASDVRFGFRNFSFLFSNSSASSGPTTCHLSDELALHDNSVMLYDLCACSMTQGQVGSSCVSCASRCQYCYGPDSSECLQCNTGLFWSGVDCCHLYCKDCTGTTQNTCSECQPGYFNYGNGTCNVSCPFPFQNKTVSGQLMCDKPCSTGKYYFAFNGSCFDDCPSPLYSSEDTINGILFCSNPCSATEQYLYMDGSCVNNCLAPLEYREEPGVQYCFNPCELTHYIFTPNGTCVDQCPIPLVNRTDTDVNYCFNPCPEPASQYLFLNESCLGTCPPPLAIIEEPGVMFCLSPCADPTGEYLYANGTCFDNCTAPLVSKNESEVMYCFNPCEEPETEFLYINGSCLEDCPSPLFNRSEPGTKYCFTPCGLGEYLFANGSCKDSCPGPLVSQEDPNVTYCFNPCQFPDSEFLYTNGSCLDTCPYPLVNRSEPGVNYCFNPCDDEDYVYWNGSCYSDCLSPLVIQAESAANYCINPCVDETEFLYPNGSCFENCTSPLMNRSEPGVIFCYNPCDESDYLYWNQTCKSECVSPLVIRIEPGVMYCDNPCLEPDTEFLFSNGSCYDTCPYPLVNRSEPGVNYCFDPCNDGDYLYWNQTCESECTSPLVIKNESGAVYCINPCENDTLYLYTNGSCFESCLSPLANWSEPGVNYCYNPCNSSTMEYLYDNETCSTECVSPLVIRIEPDVMYCYNPCLSTQYLFINSTCSKHCPSPLISRTEPGVQYCFSPCPDINDFLYTNGSCLSTCPSPLVTKIESAAKFCYNPCEYPGKYLYPNGTCLSTCPTPLLSRSEPNVDYCFLPCSLPNIYWYINASCLSKCESPYQQVTYSGVIQCLSPCKDTSLYYYDYDNACYSTCESPYTIYQVDQIKVCHSDLGLDLADIEKIKATADSIASQGAVTSTGMKAAGALSSGNPSSALLAGLSSMLEYIRYMQINYPPKVETLFLVQAGTPISISFDFNIPPGLDRLMDDHPLPYAFDKYDINSNFVRNMWDTIGSFLASVLAVFGLMIVIKLVGRLPKLKVIFVKILRVAKWNIPAMMLCSSSGDIFFYASLHINVLHLNTTTSIICFLVLLSMVGLTIWLWYLTINIVWDFDKVKKLRLEESDFKEKWEDCELLYGESEEKSALTIAYMTFFIARGVIFNLTIGCLYEYPLVQVGIINASNFMMFGYLIVYRPLKELLNLAQVFINEAMILILSVSVLILAVMDRLNIIGTSTRVNVGEAILFVIKAFNTMGLVFMGIQLLMTAIFAYKAWKYFKAKGIKNPLKMLQVLAFEDIEAEAGLEKDSGGVLGKILKAGKKPRIRKNPRKENEGIKSSFVGIENHHLNMTGQSFSTIQNNIDHNTSHDTSFDFQRGTRPMKDLDIQNESSFMTFRLDKSEEILTENDLKNSPKQKEDEISNSLKKSLRKLRLRARSPSTNVLIEKPENELDQSGILKSQNEVTEINLFTEGSNGEMRRGEDINVIENLRKLKERRTRIKSVESANKSWLSGIKKLKQYLANKKIVI